MSPSSDSESQTDRQPTVAPDCTPTALVAFLLEAQELNQVRKNYVAIVRCALRSLTKHRGGDDEALPLSNSAPIFDRSKPFKIKDWTVIEYERRIRGAVALWIQAGGEASRCWDSKRKFHKRTVQRHLEEQAAGDQVINHLFTVRAGLKLRIDLPIDLTTEEAERISSWMRALAIK